MPSIQSITDQRLIEAINSAQGRVVFVAPGIWPEVAKAIRNAWHRLGAEDVSVILDVDAEICRLGYGSIEGLKLIQEAALEFGQALGHEPGIRICIVIADDQTFIFSPTPLLIESTPGNPIAPGLSVPKANGIVLSSPPPTVAKELGADSELVSERTIGMDGVPAEKVAEVAHDLKLNPPKSFDVSRAVNVYNSAIQFAEFEVSGCRLSGQKASLPSELIKVARKNPALDKKIDKSLHLIEASDDLIQNDKLSEVTIFAERKRIELAYLKHVKGGTVIERTKKEAFSAEVLALQTLIKNFADHVSKKLEDRYVDTAEMLATEFLPNVLEDIPQAWLKKLGKSPDPLEVKYRIKDALLRSFGNPERRINAMKASVVFKDVTYDMLNHADFRASISEQFPNLEYLEEYAAAKEVADSDEDPFSFN